MTRQGELSSVLLRRGLETEEPASFLSKRIHYQGGEEEPDGEADCDLHHPISNVEDDHSWRSGSDWETTLTTETLLRDS